MNVPKIMSAIVDYGVRKPISALGNTRVMEKVCESYQSNNVQFIAGLGLLSIVLKDGLGCYMYVKQSLNNKKIPEDKRKFVAALDLANGGLMILTQVLTFFTLSNKKVQAKLFDKTFGKLFSRAARKGYQVLIKQKPKFANIEGVEFNKTFGAFKDKVQDIFGIMAALVASTVLAKRIVVPFIATPLAERAKKFLYKDSQEKEFNKDSKNTYDAKGPDLKADKFTKS